MIAILEKGVGQQQEDTAQVPWVVHVAVQLNGDGKVVNLPPGPFPPFPCAPPGAEQRIVASDAFKKEAPPAFVPAAPV